jgi:hypothetical protein
MKTDTGWALDNSDPDRFLAHLDTFSGNSGGPVPDPVTDES